MHNDNVAAVRHVISFVHQICLFRFLTRCGCICTKHMLLSPLCVCVCGTNHLDPSQLATVFLCHLSVHCVRWNRVDAICDLQSESYRGQTRHFVGPRRKPFEVIQFLFSLLFYIPSDLWRTICMSFIPCGPNSHCNNFIYSQLRSQIALQYFVLSFFVITMPTLIWR